MFDESLSDDFSAGLSFVWNVSTSVYVCSRENYSFRIQPSYIEAVVRDFLTCTCVSSSTHSVFESSQFFFTTLGSGKFFVSSVYRVLRACFENLAIQLEECVPVFVCVQLLFCVFLSGILWVDILTSQLQKWLGNIPLLLSSVNVGKTEVCNVILQAHHPERRFP